MTYNAALWDEITEIWSLSHPDDLAIPSISSGWFIVYALCHLDDLPGVGISSGLVTANSLCLPFLSHPDEIANFDFPQHAVALQRFHSSEGKCNIKFFYAMNSFWSSFFIICDWCLKHIFKAMIFIHVSFIHKIEVFSRIFIWKIRNIQLMLYISHSFTFTAVLEIISKTILSKK